jgi:cell division protein FtsI (penicillin-binding protein 3)
VERIGPEGVSFGLIPETTTPMALLAAYSVLLNGVSDRSPFVVKKILDIESRKEVLLKGVVPEEPFIDTFPHEPNNEVRKLFQAMALRKESSSYFLRDSVLLVSSSTVAKQQFAVVDLTFATIPADRHELDMLVVVHRDPESVSRREKKERSIEDILDEKVDRISVLQQISATIADVVEPEHMDTVNFQGESVGESYTDNEKVSEKNTSIPASMPDLVGLSLRKGLRLLDGSPVSIKIEGTGRIVEQFPPPGTPLKQNMECRLVLERHEDLQLEKFTEEKVK